MMAAQEREQLTIDELAQRTSVTTRNIRAHQSRGLLPPPEVRARTGYYGPDHVARLQLISEMQAEGFNLRAIKRLLDAPPDASEELLGFKRALLTPFATEQPEVIDREELEQRLGGTLDAKALRSTEKLGLVVSLGDDRYEVPSPRLLRAGEEVIALGVPLSHALAVVEKVNRHAKGVAEEFIKLFVSDVLEPRQRQLPQSERLTEIRTAFDRLRPLASQAQLAAFEQTMTREVERAFGRELER